MLLKDYQASGYGCTVYYVQNTLFNSNNLNYI